MTTETNMMPMTAAEASVVESQARAEIDIQISTAKRWPRDEEQSFKRSLAVIERNMEIAEQAFYVLKRGQNRIVGPSVRLAEIMLSDWGNIRAKTQLVNIGATHVTVQAACMDLERNIGVSCEVQRRITNKDGGRYNDDMIVMTINAASAVALRNAIFKVIPGVYVQAIFNKAKEIVMGDPERVNNLKERAIKYFESVGVTQELLLTHLGRLSTDVITKDDIEYLIGLVNAIKEGTADLDSTFGKTRTGKKIDLDNLAASLKEKQEADKPANGTANETPAEAEPPTETPARATKPAKTKAKPLTRADYGIPETRGVEALDALDDAVWEAITLMNPTPAQLLEINGGQVYDDLDADDLAAVPKKIGDWYNAAKQGALPV